MRISKLLANRFIPGARSLDHEEFDVLFAKARSESLDSIRRLSGWIFVGALVLPFLLFIVLPAFWFSEHDISLAWLVVLIPLNILISSALSEIGTFLMLYPALCRSAAIHTAATT
ncbi:MAG: hypothetical protein ACXWF6_06430 [Usitatibacter sp.]